MAEYHQIRRGACRWRVLEGWEEKIRLPEDPAGWSVRDGAQVLKETGSKAIYTVPDPEGPWIVKVYRNPRGISRIFSFLWASPGFREASLLQRIEARGVPVLLPVAAGERRGGGLAGPSCIAMQALPGSKSLDVLLLDRVARGSERRRVIREYGRFARLVHEAGILQEDFDPNNAVRIEEGGDGGSIRLIDTERVRLLDSIGDAERALSLARLYRYGRALPLTEQIRFLRAYSDGEADPRRALRKWAAAIHDAWPAVVDRDRRRARRICLEPGRLFARLEKGRISGIYRTRYGEREEPIFDASHLEPLLGRIEDSPLPIDPIPLETPIETRVGRFRGTIFPTAPAFRPRSRLRWQEANADLKEEPSADLPLAHLEVRISPLRLQGFLLLGRCDTYKPPTR